MGSVVEENWFFDHLGQATLMAEISFFKIKINYEQFENRSARCYLEQGSSLLDQEIFGSRAGGIKIFILQEVPLAWTRFTM